MALVAGWALLMAAVPARAQHQWVLEAGVAIGQAREDLVVPLRSDGGGLVLGTGWRWDGTRSQARAHVRLPIVALANPRGDVSAHYAWDVDASWDVRVGGSPLTVGPTLLGDTDLFFHIDWDDSHVYWRTLWAIGPRISASWPASDPAFTVWVAAPVAGLASRPPERWDTKVNDVIDVAAHVGVAHQGARLVTWDEVQDLRVGATWAPKQGRWAWALDGRIGRVSFPASLTTVSFSASVRRRIGRGSRA